MNETENQSTDNSLTPPKTVPTPDVMMALGRAFNKAGDKFNQPQFKEAARGLIVAANKAQLSTPKLGDQREAGTTKDPEITPSPVKSEPSGSKKTAGVGISGFPLADAVPVALVVPILLWALLPDNPYAYYRLLRWICCPCFAYLAVAAYRRDLDGWVWALGVTALIYKQ